MKYINEEASDEICVMGALTCVPVSSWNTFEESETFELAAAEASAAPDFLRCQIKSSG